MSKKITFIPNTGAGLGHQFVEWLWGFTFCYDNNITFFHHRFLGNSENGDKMLGLGFGEYQYSDYLGKSLSKEDMALDEYLSSDEDCLYVFEWNYFEHRNYVLHIDESRLIKEDIRNILRKKYHSVAKESCIVNQISVHIRREGITAPVWADRYLPIGYFVSILDELYLEYPTYKVNIFSSGIDDDFYTVKTCNYTDMIFDIGGELDVLLSTFLHSDVLVLSKSDLSFYIALLSEITQKKICPNNFWHKWPEESILI